jgi:hypothetical protein
MGASLNVVFNKKTPPYGLLSDDHNALGNGLERLDKLLAKVGLPTLGEFVSGDPAEWENMDDEDPEARAMPPEQWFRPADGLAAVRAAIELLRQRPKAISWSAVAIEELQQVEAELAAADARKTRFHFAIND